MWTFHCSTCGNEITVKDVKDSKLTREYLISQGWLIVKHLESTRLLVCPRCLARNKEVEEGRRKRGY
jgi:DNA-directed RNA polymerase subunit RPC12/RpoP